MNKKADEIISNRVYEVPKTTLTPVNQRILCWEIPAGEVKTASGIIIPDQVTKADKAGDTIRKPRFVVVR